MFLLNFKNILTPTVNIDKFLVREKYWHTWQSFLRGKINVLFTRKSFRIKKSKVRSCFEEAREKDRENLEAVRGKSPLYYCIRWNVRNCQDTLEKLRVR